MLNKILYVMAFSVVLMAAPMAYAKTPPNIPPDCITLKGIGEGEKGAYQDLQIEIYESGFNYDCSRLGGSVSYSEIYYYNSDRFPGMVTATQELCCTW